MFAPAALLAFLLIPGAVHATSWPSLSRPARSTGGGKYDAAVIVGIERYAFVPPVPGAKANALAWYDYFTKTRGTPPENVILLRDSDGTLEEMKTAAAKAAKRAGKPGTLWFIFIGHGAPAKDGKDGLLIGVDAQQKAASLQARSLRRGDLLSALGKSKAGSVRVVLDACFSGRGPGGAALAPGLQPLLTVVNAPVRDPRFVVLTAAKGNQFAGALPGARRPAFSYLTLGGLRGWADKNKDGEITAAELLGYSKNALDATLRGRHQTPTLMGPRRAVMAGSAGERGPDIADMAKIDVRPKRRGSMFKVSALPAVPQAPKPMALGGSGLSGDWSGVDVDALEKYDAALKTDKSGKPAAVKAKVWRDLAKSSAQFKKQATRRAREWGKFAAAESAKKKARKDRLAAKNKDFKKLSRLLALDVVSKTDKGRYATMFVNAYSQGAAKGDPQIKAASKYLNRRARFLAGLDSSEKMVDIFGQSLFDMYVWRRPKGRDFLELLYSRGKKTLRGLAGVKFSFRTDAELKKDYLVYSREGRTYRVMEMSPKLAKLVYSAFEGTAKRALAISLTSAHPLQWELKGAAQAAGNLQAAVAGGRLIKSYESAAYDYFVGRAREGLTPGKKWGNYQSALRESEIALRFVEVYWTEENGVETLFYARRDEENPESYAFAKLPAKIEPEKINALVDQSLEDLAEHILLQKYSKGKRRRRKSKKRSRRKKSTSW